MLSSHRRPSRVTALKCLRYVSTLVTPTRRRGRPRNADSVGTSTGDDASPRPRGRPCKVPTDTLVEAIEPRQLVEDDNPSISKPLTTPNAGLKQTKKNLRPRKSKEVRLSTKVKSANPIRKRSKQQSTHLSTLAIAPGSEHHHDLPSFLTYAARKKLRETTNVYKGTHYEYTVVSSLDTLDFDLVRTGRSSDLGIDLIGHWTLPATPHTLRCIVQCKAVKPGPAMVRELEGAYAGAPVAWRGDGVMALLVCSREATKGVRDAVQRSRWPMGVLQVSKEGEIKQFVWNAVAAASGLEGMSVTARYATRSRRLQEDFEVSTGGTVTSSIALTWMGKPWRP